MGELTCTWDVLQSSDGGGSVLQFTFRGPHDYTHGRQMITFMESVTTQTLVSAIVINLLDYTYESGDDVFGLFLTDRDRTSCPTRPVCILAEGRTQTALKALLAEDHMGTICDVSLAACWREMDDWMRRRGLGREAPRERSVNRV